MKTVTWFIFLLLVAACTRTGNETQEHKVRSVDQTIRTFIDVSAHAKAVSDRLKLKALCVGQMSRAFEQMNDDVFKLSYVNSGIKIIALDILETSVAKNTARVRYRVSVENPQGSDATTEVNEREVQLLLDKGSWFIESIRLFGTDRVAFMRGMIF